MKRVTGNHLLWENFSENFEETVQQVQNFQREFNKTSLELLKEQHEQMITIFQHYYDLEDEWKNRYENFLQTMQEQNFKFHVEDWMEKMREMIEQLTEQSNQILEQSQQKMCALTNALLTHFKEQQQMFIENIDQWIEINNDLVKNANTV